MKINRDAFLYLPPKPPKASFAQCATCRDWVSGDRRCVIHGPKINVPGSASCGLYVNGVPRMPGTKTHPDVTPEQSGLVNRAVRCENCKYMEGPALCGLFDMLNKKLPSYFDLDTKIEAQGCCNAQTPGGDHD